MGSQGHALAEPLLQLEDEQQKGVLLKEHIITVDNAKAHNVRDGASSWTSWRDEVGAQAWIAAPMVYVNILQLSLQLISVMFVGRLGRLPLAGASIASSFANVTGSSVLMGMASALETLCGQAFGAKRYRLVGIYLQRAILVLVLTSIPLAFIWGNVDRLLLVVGQESDIADSAGEYASSSHIAGLGEFTYMLVCCLTSAKWLIPYVFAYAVIQALIRFLQAQSLVFPIVACSTVTVCFHGPLCWLLIYKVGLGHRGAALATSISNWAYVASLLAYICFSSACRHTRASLSREALNELIPFIKLATPAALMICLEWWSFEILVLASGLLPDPQLSSSTLAIVLNTSALAFTIPWGLGAAVSTRVSNELGAGRPQVARVSMFVSLGLTSVASIVMATVIFCARDLIGKAFSNDKEVIAYVASIMPVAAFSIIFDSLQTDFSGVVRGCGRQKIGAFINLGCYYAIGLPISFILAFILGLGGKGLWMGITCGCLTQAVLLFSIVISTNWEKEASEASSRISLSSDFGFLSKALEKGILQ